MHLGKPITLQDILVIKMFKKWHEILTISHTPFTNTVQHTGSKILMKIVQDKGLLCFYLHVHYCNSSFHELTKLIWKTYNAHAVWT